jgi:hypothetical protein
MTTARLVIWIVALLAALAIAVESEAVIGIYGYLAFLPVVAFWPLIIAASSRPRLRTSLNVLALTLVAIDVVIAIAGSIGR